MKIEIKHRFSDSVIFEYDCEDNTIKKTVLEAVKKKINLSGADLSGADLRGAYLSDADLSDADLSDADLSGAYLIGAYLSGADLSGAYLRGADLSDADLSDADLRGAEKKISKTQEDFYEVLNMQPNEVDGLLQKLREGKINGSVYEGECCCLVGTIAAVKQCSYKELSVQPNASRRAERFFLSIKPGQTPENSKKCKEIEGWILDWQKQNTINS